MQETNPVSAPFHFDLQMFADGSAESGSESGNQSAANTGTQSSSNESAGDDLSKKSAEELAEYARELRRREAATRKKYEDSEKTRAELAKWREERENAELAEQNKHKELYEKEVKKREKLEQERAAESKAKDERYIRAEVRAAAIRLGIHDPKDVDNFDVSDLRLDESGNVAGIEDFVSAQKTAKPHWFKAAENSQDQQRRGTPPPDRASGEKNGISDWANASAADLTKELDRLMTSK